MTDDITFEDEPNSPPVILTRPGEPEIGSNVWIDKSERSEWALHLQVRDENVEQSLEGHWRIRQEPETAVKFEPFPIAGGNQLVRDVDLFISTDGLQEYGCHRLEIVVSGSFITELTEPPFFSFVLPEDADDVAYASWTIWEGEGRNTQDTDLLRVAKSCQALATTLATEVAAQEDMP